MTQATQQSPATPDAAQSPARGKLKIFFGAFPGAGKTNAMLTAAQRVRESGRDVVAGVVDAHESSDRALLKGFETLPPPVIEGAPAPGELDLDAALARRPEVILVDDLAHANPPGSRHPKRWNDADELLAHGIDVYTTMSVQHLESLNDVVGEITGIRETETVPDTFFDTADETVMVDMSADELLVRLREGKVHIGTEEKGSQGTYFSKGSLLALREIALRRTADVVEDEVQKYRADKDIEGVWRTQEHVLVCIGPEPGSEHVVRSAARLAKQLDADWTAVYVETPRLQRLPVEERGRILNVVKLAEELGAKTAILTGAEACGAIVEYARDQNISTVVVGRGQARRLPFARSMSDAIASANETIDVIEIGRGGTDAGKPVATPSARASELPSARAGEKRVRYVWTVAACALTTVAANALYPGIDRTTVAMLYMLTVVLLAVKWGRGPAIIAAILNVLAFDFFFVPPRFSLVPSDPQHLLTFAVMLAAGVFIGQLAGSLRFQARVASHREKRARTLYEFARDLAQLRTTSEVIQTAEDFMSRHFRSRVAVLVPDTTGMLVSPTGRGMSNPFDSTAAQWAYDQAQTAGAGTDTLAGNEYLFLPLKSPTRTRGVLAVRPERTRDLFIPEQRHQYEIFATLVATALERVHYVDVARDALLMAGIQSGDVELELEHHPLGDLIDRALRLLGAVLAKHKIDVDVPADLPPALVDAALMQRVFASVIGNAAKHTPAGTQITIGARRSGDALEVTVEDNGPGLPKGREEEVFESFARGEKQATRRGAGLGLAISRAIVAAHGGTIRAEPGRKKGARFVITIPMERK
jgi:two-component system sensor histidine kinase KdpD